ncbi:MAG: pyrroline-5-carboxylate reductase [Halobacteriovoraceae bacterium]|nr:pyrroline-5-carboxylate reductase [Halobacteriovoraceae bacterium]MBC99227.1 pyrroline-5-carboxylate reductase [Halobacteriovoraceae bacterium]|tara:strand:+ start:134771 stop:135577 length:807 start_codon:yes stop_codon:yes gene_type:complete
MIGVIGCGNMASAIVTGMHEKFPLEKFLTYTPSFTRAEELAKKVGGKAVKELSELQECEYLLIGCKPQQFSDLADGLKRELPSVDQKYIVSMMAAVSIDSITKKLGSKEVTRVMPNTPIRHGEGISLLLHTGDDSNEKVAHITKLFKACSHVYTMKNEEQFDKVTTVSGSGPAYIFYLADILSQSLKGWGMQEQEATELAIQLMKGSVELMSHRGDVSLSQLVDQVTSKKGVTIEAVEVFKNQGLPELVEKALGAACNRSLEMTKEFS